MNVEFEEILTQYTPLIKGQIKQLRLTSHYDECFQIGAIALWNAFSKFEPDKGEFPAYAKLRVRGELVSHLRKEIQYSERYLLTNESTEHLLEHAQTEAIEPTMDFPFSPFLQFLSPRELLYVEHILIKGKSIKAVAKEQGVTQHTVSSWSKTARRKLREAGQQIGDPRRENDMI